MKDKKPISQLERIAVRLTESVGSVQSLILHSIAFVVIFALGFFGISFEAILLILTTAVSLEAIYLAIFIQMTVNRNTQSLEAVEEDIDEIERDIDEIQVDVDEMQGEFDEIHKDVDDVLEDVEEESQAGRMRTETLESIQSSLGKLMVEIEVLKKNRDK